MKFLRHLLVYGSLSALASPLSFGAITLLSSLAQEHTLAPGESFEGQIILRNSGTEPATARITQTDYRFSADGSNDFGSPGTLSRSNARWLAPTTSLIRFAPGEVVALKYRGRVPTVATLPGSYWSIIMVEDSALIPGDNGISTRTRYGVQIVTHCGKSAVRSIRFGKHESQNVEGGSALLLDVENDGERLVFPKLWVEIFDQAGAKLGRFGGEAARLYPDCSARYRIALPSMPKGAYRALILADCGEDQVVGTQCELAF